MSPGGGENAVEIERVGVVGCGLMGSGIAEVCARAGLDVVVVERDADALDAGRARVDGSLTRAVRAIEVSECAPETTRTLLRFEAAFVALAERKLVGEAVAEY